MTRTLAIMTVTLAIGAASAQVAPKPPATPFPPSGPAIPAAPAAAPAFLPNYQNMAEVLPGTETVAFEVSVCKPVTKTVQKTVEVDGKQETRTVAICEYVCEKVLMNTSLAAATGYDGTGQKL